MLNQVAEIANQQIIENLKLMLAEGNPLAYAAGAIEDASDNGIGSRESLKKATSCLRMRIVSPCDFEYNQPEFPSMKDYMRAHTLEETYAYAQPIIDGDIEAVRDCDFLLAYLDDKAGPGTASECTLAKALGKPVVGVFAPGCDRKKIHPWIFGMPNIFFDSFEDFAAFVSDLQSTRTKS